MQGDREAALDELEQARELLARAGATPEWVRVQLDLARLHADRGAPENLREARSCAAAALAEASRLGMQPWARRARALAEDLGIEVPGATAAAPAPDGWEMQLLTELGRGKSEAGIADALLVHPDALRKELSRLYARLGIAGRLEAAALAVEGGLIEHVLPERGIQLTIMVTDLCDFTAMVEALGDARAQRVIRLHNRLVRGCLREHAGTEITHTGDGVIASFRSAAEAVGCALALQQALARYNESAPISELRVRVGLHTGEVRTEEGRLFGSAVNLAVRICGVCEAGRILLSSDVQRRAGAVPVRMHNRGPHRLKGRERPLELYEIDLNAAAPSGAAREHSHG